MDRKLKRCLLIMLDLFFVGLLALTVVVLIGDFAQDVQPFLIIYMYMQFLALYLTFRLKHCTMRTDINVIYRFHLFNFLFSLFTAVTGYLELVKSINGDGMLKHTPTFFGLHLLALMSAHIVIAVYICCPQLSLSERFYVRRGRPDPNGAAERLIQGDPRTHFLSFEQLQLKNQVLDPSILKDNTCSICLEDFVNSNQIIKELPLCKHLFHENCLKSWYETAHQDTCPVCRRRFSFRSIEEEREQMLIEESRRWENFTYENIRNQDEIEEDHEYEQERQQNNHMNRNSSDNNQPEHDMDSMSQQLELTRLLSEKMYKNMAKTDQNLISIEKRVQPIQSMAETVQICKDNINLSLEKINTINMNINEQEEVVQTLERRILNSEFDLYLKYMDRAIDVLESKKHLKRFKELLRTLENATSSDQFSKYVKFYMDVRRERIKSKSQFSDNDASVSSSQSDMRMSLITGPNTGNYQKGSHPIISQEELQAATSVFQLTQQNSLNIGLKVNIKLMQRLCKILDNFDKEVSSEKQIRAFLVVLDILETMHEMIPNFFLRLMKIKELPLKKQIEQVLVRCQEFLKNQREAYINVSLVYQDLVDCVQEVEQRKDALKKQYAQKFQFIINNYGLMNYRIDQFETVFKLTDLDLVTQLKESLQFHVEQFGLYFWKSVRPLLQKIQEAKKDKNFEQISDEIQQKIDQLIKGIKKYKFVIEDQQLKIQLKESIVNTVREQYEFYTKVVKPSNAYTLEDIELTIDKLLRIN
ncbi:ring-h2 finger protein rha1b [Stylonychia lemnae]|uniref:Ring-h2 finger protein rha1b n=1 Tax=Stylonychia lemnae TaxID=5949 RepID=A0A078B5X1_STYLE|nr:ring-h2 finger protein rha1b [Stylonychia lemnae]|eukprot:CDW88717.1 ring-h2 finger protein rha1b [Stylonychia lemnae]